MKVEFDGAGEVARRIMELYFSAGQNNVIATKRSLNDDIRTLELAKLNKKYPFDLYLDSSNLDQFRKKADELGLKLKGKRTDIDLKDISYIVNGMDDKIDKKIMQEIINEYQKYNKIFLLQGGADYNIIQNDFLSAPLAVGNLEMKNFINKSARQVSCNTTYSGTALGLVLRAFRNDDIEKIYLYLQRRSRDPGEKKELKYEQNARPSHHAEDVEHIFPQLKGKIFSLAQKMPWEHYHRAEVTIKFKEKLESIDIHILKDIFKLYNRCVYTENEIGGKELEKGLKGIEMLLKISNDLNIPDGDILLPTYNISKIDDYSIKISGYNPQRSIIALSCIDWLWIVQGEINSWHDIFAETNKLVKWHGYSIAELKQKMEEKINGYKKNEYEKRISER